MFVVLHRMRVSSQKSVQTEYSPMTQTKTSTKNPKNASKSVQFWSPNHQISQDWPRKQERKTPSNQVNQMISPDDQLVESGHMYVDIIPEGDRNLELKSDHVCKDIFCLFGNLFNICNVIV